jgi:hypothetical protein
MQKNERRATMKVNPTPAAYLDHTVATAIQARRESARRLPPMECGCSDPWPCRCASAEPSDKGVEGYLEAVAHLSSLGLLGAPFLPELRALWRRGDAERRIVRDITSRWAVAR